MVIGETEWYVVRPHLSVHVIENLGRARQVGELVLLPISLPLSPSPSPPLPPPPLPSPPPLPPPPSPLPLPPPPPPPSPLPPPPPPSPSPSPSPCYLSVTDDHQFKNEYLFYRFRYDDGTFRHKQDIQDVHVRGLRVYLRLQGMYTPKIK